MQNQHNSHDDAAAAEPILVDGTEYDGSVYEETTRAVGSQQEVANWWAEGKLPTHEKRGMMCVLRSGTGNFRGQQRPDGSGRLVHYSTLEAVRTLNQTVVSNTECYARGWAHCSSPGTEHCPRGDIHGVPLTSLARATRRADLRHIVDVINADRDDHTRLSDPDGYDRLVVFDPDDEPTEAYRAGYDGVDPEPLSDAQIDGFLDEITTDD